MSLTNNQSSHIGHAPYWARIARAIFSASAGDTGSAGLVLSSALGSSLGLESGPAGKSFFVFTVCSLFGEAN